MNTSWNMQGSAIMGIHMPVTSFREHDGHDDRRRPRHHGNILGFRRALINRGYELELQRSADHHVLRSRKRIAE